ncbi:MAG: hypothetical protein JNM59_01585 [Hyphomonadaceae bacterium]|nr:hypothetical protein [Hyphomonadaceae bacterium]
MSKTLIKRIVATLVVSVALAGAATAQGYRVPTEIAPGALQGARGTAQTYTVNCQGSDPSPFGDALVCRGFAEITLNSDGPGAQIAVRLTAPPTHCTAVQYVVQNVSTERGVMSGWLEPGASELVPAADDLPRGAHRYRIWAWGRIGGCLRDTVHSFAVTVEPTIIP